MRFAIAIWFALAAMASGQTLEIKGDTKTIEVPRTVIVLDKVQVVTSLPFSITAPTGGALYSWSFPATITATKLGGVLTITAAPKGTLTISCEWIVIDFEAKKFESKAASLAFAVGEVVPPKPISADNPFAVAWAMETNAKRQAYVAVIAALYRGYATEAKTAATGKALFDFMSAAYLAAETDGEKVAGKLPRLVATLNQWIVANLKTPEGALSATDRAAAEAVFLKAARWLGEFEQ